MSIFGRHQRQVRRYNPDDPQPNATDQSQFEPPKKHRLRKWLGLSLLVLIILAAIAALIAYLYIDTTVLRGEKEGRINIMVLGVDDTATLSDTIMVASIDTRHGEEPKVALISVPRDLYVDIGDFGEQKINAAYTYGQNNDYPGGGPALTQSVLEDVLGIKIHYYATLDFTGFEQLIDSVGGVTVDVKQAIEDPFYPTQDYSGYDYFELPAGSQTLDGVEALRYARSRQTTTDFDRAARQQQILIAYKDKVVSKDTLIDLKRVSEIQATLKEHFDTNMSLREMAKLGKLLREVPDSHITRHVIDNSNFLVPYPFGSAYVPSEGVFDYTEIHEFARNIFSLTGNTLPEAQQ